MRFDSRATAVPLRRRLLIAIVAVAVILVLFPAGASAQGGALTQPSGAAGCLSETGSNGDCAKVSGIGDVTAVAISPDGRNVYAVGHFGQSLAVFARDPETGGLTEMMCYSLFGDPPCTTVFERALSEPTAVTVSADGRSVYVSNKFDEISLFARDPATGLLSQPSGESCIASTGAPGCPANGVALGVAESVAVSPDGHNVYVGADEDGAIAEFGRNPATSALTQPADKAACVTYDTLTATSNTGMASDCAFAAVHLNHAQSLAFSPGSDYLYVADDGAHALWSFSRDTTTGVLGSGGCQGGTGVDCPAIHGLNDPQQVAVSTDGTGVIATSGSPGGVTALRAGPLGTLTESPQVNGLHDCYTNDGSDGCIQGRALAGASGVAISPDSSNVYVASATSGAIASFARDAATNRLSQLDTTAGCVSDNGSGGVCTLGHDLHGVRSIVVSPDGRNVYAAAESDSAVVVLDREQSPTSPTGTPGPTGPSGTPGLGAGAGPGGPGGGSRAPRVSGFSISPSRFAVTARRRAPGRRARPRGTRFRFTLSVSARMSITFTQQITGVRRGARCLAATSQPPRAHAKRCKVVRTIGSISLADEPAGLHRVRFGGQLRRRALRPGRYLAVVVASNPAGRSARVERAFQVLP